jgi:hypothetical protein
MLYLPGDRRSTSTHCSGSLDIGTRKAVEQLLPSLPRRHFQLLALPPSSTRPTPPPLIHTFSLEHSAFSLIGSTLSPLSPRLRSKLLFSLSLPPSSPLQERSVTSPTESPPSSKPSLASSPSDSRMSSSETSPSSSVTQTRRSTSARTSRALGRDATSRIRVQRRTGRHARLRVASRG